MCCVEAEVSKMKMSLKYVGRAFSGAARGLIYVCLSVTPQSKAVRQEGADGLTGG